MFHKPLLKRYYCCLKETLKIFSEKRYNTCIVQNPSAILSLTAIVYNKIASKKIIIDAHNVGIMFENKRKSIRFLGQLCNDFIIKNTDMVIVTNDGLADTVKEKGGYPFVLEDPLPELKYETELKLDGEKKIFLICSFSNDEPYLNVFKAIEKLGNKVILYVSGNYKKINPNIHFPENIVFTGYVNEYHFNSILFASDLIIDLTLRENCLVCGAYEAIQMDKPLLLSETEAQKNYFGRLAYYTNNTTVDIHDAISSILKKDKYKSQRKALKKQLETNWESKKNQFLARINEI